MGGVCVYLNPSCFPTHFAHVRCPIRSQFHSCLLHTRIYVYHILLFVMLRVKLAQLLTGTMSNICYTWISAMATWNRRWWRCKGWGMIVPCFRMEHPIDYHKHIQFYKLLWAYISNPINYSGKTAHSIAVRASGVDVSPRMTMIGLWAIYINVFIENRLRMIPAKQTNVHAYCTCS